MQVGSLAKRSCYLLESIAAHYVGSEDKTAVQRESWLSGKFILYYKHSNILKNEKVRPITEKELPPGVAIRMNMDVSNIASLATSMAQQRNDMDVSIAVLKKTIDVQGAMAIALIEAVPTANLPAHLGNHVNTTA